MDGGELTRAERDMRPEGVGRDSGAEVGACVGVYGVSLGKDNKGGGQWRSREQSNAKSRQGTDVMDTQLTFMPSLPMGTVRLTGDRLLDDRRVA